MLISIRNFVLGIILIASYGSANSQERAPQPPPKFASETSLVTVPVIVLRHGKHVSGLHESDFRIKEDGHNQAIASFEEINASTSWARAISPAPGIYTNEVLREGPLNLTVVVLDLINTPFLYQD